MSVGLAFLLHDCFNRRLNGLIICFLLPVGGNPSSNVIVSSGKRVNVAESVVETKREAGLAADAAQHHDKKSQAEAVRAAQPSDNCVTIC